MIRYEHSIFEIAPYAVVNNPFRLFNSCLSKIQEVRLNIDHIFFYD